MVFYTFSRELIFGFIMNNSIRHNLLLRRYEIRSLPVREVLS